MRTGTTWSSRQPLLWAGLGVVGAVLARTNPSFPAPFSRDAGLLALGLDALLVVALSSSPRTAPAGVLVGGLFLAVPLALDALPMERFLLMCAMGAPFAFAVVLTVPPPTVGFRSRWAYLFTWLGTREVRRRASTLDLVALRRLTVATLVNAVTLSATQAIPPVGMGLAARWFVGGLSLLAFAEMVTAGHDFVTALMGVTAPALMRSPHRSKSLREFWGERWNPAASALIFRKCCFDPLARRGVGRALSVAFLASAGAHAALLWMATQRWGPALMWGSFFLLQPAFIVLERRLNVRRWPLAAGWAWTQLVLTLTSPLLVGPLLGLVEPSWKAPDRLVPPALQVLALVLLVNVLVAFGSRVSSPSPAA